MRVFIYWNIRSKCFSVKALEGPNKGKVVSRVAYFEVADATFRVSEAGRLRVLATGHKNVHAGIEGRLVAEEPAFTGPAWATGGFPRTNRQENSTGAKPVTYNPRAYTSFVESVTLRPVRSAPFVRGYAGNGIAMLFATAPR